MSNQFWNLVIITGASRGFGECIAKSYASKLAENTSSSTQSQPLHLVLTARTASDLNIVKNAVMEARGSIVGDLLIDTIISDLGNGTGLDHLAQELFDKPFSRDQDAIPRVYNKITFINNAGSLGPLQTIGSGEDYMQVSSAFQINITSSLYLTSQLIHRFTTGKYPSLIKSLDIVNVSSLAAIQPFESWGYYCAGKAARDMFHKVVAAEHINDGIKILNYAPGPLDTDMQREIRECMTVKEDTRQYFASLKAENKLVDPNTSAKKLLLILSQSTYESGAHVDYYEMIEGIDKPFGCTCVPTCSCDVSSVCSCSNNAATGCGKRGSCCCSGCTCGADCKCGTPAAADVISACGLASCACGPSCGCGSDCACGKASTSSASTMKAGSCCGGDSGCNNKACSSGCTCGADCKCGTPTAASIVSACGSATCACGPSCGCGADCTCGQASTASSKAASCCGGDSGCNNKACSSGCTCGADCKCGTPAAANIASACGSATCACGASCGCGSDCTCGQSNTSTVKAVTPSCRAASVCTCGPTCECKELKRPCCDACNAFTA